MKLEVSPATRWIGLSSTPEFRVFGFEQDYEIGEAKIAPGEGFTMSDVRGAPLLCAHHAEPPQGPGVVKLEGVRIAVRSTMLSLEPKRLRPAR